MYISNSGNSPLRHAILILDFIPREFHNNDFLNSLSLANEIAFEESHKWILTPNQIPDFSH